MYILAHDLGTSGNKATLFSADGEILASEFAPYPSFYGTSGEAEQDPNDWWAAVVTSSRALFAKVPDAPQKIAAVGFSGHMMGCLAIDSEGNPIGRSMLHSDTRSNSQAQRIASVFGAERIYRISGNPADPHYPLSKIMWLKENHPDVYDKTSSFIQSKDFVAGRLTGRFGLTDCTDASLYGLFNMANRCWSDDITSAAGIDSAKLPEIVESKAEIGRLTKEAAEATGLLDGTPVIIGGGDGACAAVGASAIAPGEAYNYIGTTSWISVTTEKPLLDPKMRLFVLCNLDSTNYSVLGTVQSAGEAYSWAADTLCAEETERAAREGLNRYALMDELAQKVPTGSDMLIFLPYLMGERAPIWDPNARGTYFGLSINHNRAHMVRAVLEGVSYALNSIIEVIESLGTDVSSVRVIGGGAESPLWREMLASIWTKPVLTPFHLKEATSYGAAIAAGVGVGLFEDFSAAKQLIKMRTTTNPTPGCIETYRRGYNIFKGLYPALKDSFAKLAEARDARSNE